MAALDMSESAASAAPDAPAQTYGARDVCNAPQIRAAIGRRSAARGDPTPVAQWMNSHFFRYVVGNFQAGAPALARIDSLAAARQRLGVDLPPWVAARLAAGSTKAGASELWWIDPDSAALCQLEQRLLEFLGSRQGTPLQGKLMRVNAVQALALWEREHQAFEARQQSGWRTHQPDAVAVRWQGQGGAFVELLAVSPHFRAELAYESQGMRHCVGQFGNRRKLTGGYGEHYAAACEAGRMRIFSYRTGQAQPRMTLSAWVKDGGALEIEQIKGRQNRPPVAKYHADLLAFLRFLPTIEATPNDALAIDLVRLPAGWLPVREIAQEEQQLALFARYPDKLALVPAASPLVRWLALARAPEMARPPAGSAARAALALAGIEPGIEPGGSEQA
ncbi:MAG: hypothetical protein LBQ32_09860 [Burkholderiaceae bacterium]|nr:hypothetical protein [Burkholderiaceae bacterium]